MMFFQRKWCRLCATLRTGKQQYDSYRESVLVQGTTSIHDPIKRNSFRLFRCPTQKYRRSDKSRELKEDVSLFSHLYIAAQSRESDLGNFFKHENHPYPPSLSDRGALRTGTKSDLLPCLVKAKQTDVLVATEALSTTDSAECDDDVESSDLRDFDIEKTDNIEVGEVPPDVLMSLSDASAIQPDCGDKPSPEDWGWTKVKSSQTWTPYWTSLENASKVCRELIKCGCKSETGCSASRCSCLKLGPGWKCTELCSCMCTK
eukprot:TRINITY_DN34414_c0_g1_i3.p1 TRINITY_DN34414_c0_g1~~TRINITY_DN34414_c0_g1_i3.p1  ORF type:complete len:260 (-),score=47.01 TRINITY_DN34414_c0_g1_i3:371-1150(-)